MRGRRPSNCWHIRSRAYDDIVDAEREDEVNRAREMLQRAGRLDPRMTDQEVMTAMGELMRERVPAPAVPAGKPIISGRAWLSDALTAGGLRAPEDRRQRADLGDGGPDVDLGLLGVLGNASPVRRTTGRIGQRRARGQVPRLVGRRV